MKAGLKETSRIIIGFALGILTERQKGRAALAGIEHDRNRLRQRLQDLLGPGDAIPIARNRPEAVGDGRGRIAEVLDLLEDGIGQAAGEDIACQQKDGEAISVGDGRGGDHVGCTRADRGKRNHDLAPVHGLGISNAGKGHRLLVLTSPGGKVVLHLFEGFGEAGDISVAEDAEKAGKEWRLAAVEGRSLGHEETNERLGHSEPNGFHALFLPIEDANIELEADEGPEPIIIGVQFWSGWWFTRCTDPIIIFFYRQSFIFSQPAC